MPNYNTQVPPYSIFPGDVALAFNSEAPAAGQASQQFALPSYSGFPENGRAHSLADHLRHAPSAVSVVLQTAMVDADAQYATMDTSTPPPANRAPSPACAAISCAPKCRLSPAARA